MKKDNSRVRLCLTLILLCLFLSGPTNILGNWGLEVGRANAADVAWLAQDWMTYRRERARLDEMTENVLGFERQRQLLPGDQEGMTNEQIYLEAQEYFLAHLIAPLQRIALSPAASCAEARFAFAEMLGVRRQQQLMALEESPVISSVYSSIEAMATSRCRDEALDECVATGRFKQIFDLMMGTQRQMQMMGGEGDEESWAEDALKQCAIYELHFVSTTKDSQDTPVGAMEVATVRDGRVQIRLEIPPGGFKSARASPGELLKGETKGGNNPFFVSVKCKMPQPPGAPVNLTCSPGADSSPIKIRINELDLEHREFYIAFEKDKYTLREAPFPRERRAGKDMLSFEFEGGEFDLKGVIKMENDSFDWPMENAGGTFYEAHKKDQIDGRSSYTLKIEKSPQRGAYPVIFKFTYADQENGVAVSADSTEFELIHKPEPKPFRKVPEPIRKPLRAPNK